MFTKELAVGRAMYIYPCSAVHTLFMKYPIDVLYLDKNNKVVSNLGGNEPVYKDGKLEGLYQTEKAFSYPHDVCIDDEGSLYVAQWNSGKVYPYKLTPVT